MSLIEANSQHEVGILKPALAVAAIAAAGSVAYRGYKAFNKQVDPAVKVASMLPYCEDIANEIMDHHEAVVVGGLPIDVFNAPDSIVDVENRTIHASNEFDTLLLRDNNTVRDYDVMVIDKDADGKFVRMSDDQQSSLKKKLTSAANKRAKKNNQPAPEMSVFSFDEHSSLFHSATVVNEDGSLSLVQGFVEQHLPEESMQIWDLVLANGVTVKILSPWEQYWRSMVRFSSGMKPKDALKLEQMYDGLMKRTLAEQENSELCNAYARFLDNMLMGNSQEALRQELLSMNLDVSKVRRVALLNLARFAMETGQKSPVIQQIVQGTPKVFNLFVGSK